MRRIWRKQTVNSEIVSQLASEINSTEIIATLLVNRNLVNKEEVENFFVPTLDKLPNPMLMSGIESSISRIIKAIVKKEKIAIYGDFDCDGITSTSILYGFLESMDANVTFYNPHRIEEGYGINFQSIEKLVNNGVSLIVSTDCGISENEVVLKSKKLPVDFIITDHHTVPDVLPEAFSIINPKIKECKYPFKEICAAGVVFNLIVALRTKLRSISFFNGRPEPNLSKYLDLVSIGTVADSMPILGVNRIFVYNGLKQIAATERKGLKSLIGKQKEKYSVRDISFGIAPKINAAGRVGSATDAVKLLTSKDEKVVEQLISIIEKNNLKRQEIQEQVLKEAENLAKSEFIKNPTRSSLVLYSNGWHPGVIGIIASRIVKQFGVPCAVLSLNDSIAKGSLRTVNNINLYTILEQCSDLLIQFGGHSGAAGVTINEDSIEDFKNKFENLIAEYDFDSGELIELECEINFENIKIQLVREIEKMEPFGNGNPFPIFFTNNVTIKNKKIIKEKHLELLLEEDSIQHRAIWFNFRKPLPTANIVNVAFSIQKDSYRGGENIVLNIVDIQEP